MLKRSITHLLSSVIVLLALSTTACNMGRPAGSTPTVPIVETVTPASTSTPTLTSTPTSTDTPASTPTGTATATPVAPMVEAKDISAYCRFGPGMGYLPVGYLDPGTLVPVEGTVKDHSWWEIRNPSNPASYCWVGNAVTHASGDLSLVPIVAAPNGNATGITVSTTAVVHGNCSGSNNTNTFEGTVTTNGPGAIVYHWEVDNSAGDVLITTSATALSFETASTQAVAPGSYTGGCGNYIVKLIVTFPNYRAAEASYQVE